VKHDEKTKKCTKDLKTKTFLDMIRLSVTKTF